MMAGQYTENVEIIDIVEVVNDYGEREMVERPIAHTKAKVDSESGGRSENANEIIYTHNKTFYVHMYVMVTDNSIIVYEGKKYRIVNIEKRRMYNDLQITTELINE